MSSRHLLGLSCGKPYTAPPWQLTYILLTIAGGRLGTLTLHVANSSRRCHPRDWHLVLFEQTLDAIHPSTLPIVSVAKMIDELWLWGQSLEHHQPMPKV